MPCGGGQWLTLLCMHSYDDVLPFDHNRVKLEGPSDYINAVRSHDGTGHYSRCC